MPKNSGSAMLSFLIFASLYRNVKRETNAVANTIGVLKMEASDYLPAKHRTQNWETVMPRVESSQTFNLLDSIPSVLENVSSNK